jgi:hypothetical protein
MSYQIGLDTILLKPTPRFAHTEYCSHEPLIRAVAQAQPGQSFADAWDFDFLWVTHDGPDNWFEKGRATDMGHAEFLEGGRDKRDAKPCPFKTVEEALAFDPAKEYGLQPLPDLVKFFEGVYRKGQADHPNQVFTGGYYKTIVSGAIQAFGWDMLLEAAAHRRRFEQVLDAFYRYSRHHYCPVNFGLTSRSTL